MSGFTVWSDDENFEIQIKVRTGTADNPQPSAEAVAAALTKAYRKAFEEIEIRLGPIQIDGIDDGVSAPETGSSPAR